MATHKSLLVSLVLMLAGCQLGDHAQETATGTSTHNILTHNILTHNILTHNILTHNILTHNALEQATDTSDGRELMSYVVRCALEEGTTITVEHDGEEYQFDGLIGLAPEWVSRPLTLDEERWLTACLASHANAVGASVAISIRADGVLSLTQEERDEYKVYEGSFFGNIFNGQTDLYSCLGDDADVALANSPDRALRICADDTEDCVIQSLGRCRDVCDTRTADQGWSDCWANGEMYSETVSVYLYSPDDDGNNQTCAAGGHCEFTVKQAEDGIMDCSEAGNCKATCKDDSICAIDGTAATTLRAKVRDEAIADVNCHEANDCRVEVQDESRVEIDCKDANDCTSITCTGGSDCLLDCTGAADCGFDVCEGGLNYCEGGIVVCNRECP